MKIKFIRNMETEKNKEQEDFFERAINLELFYDVEKIINKFDSWSFKNVKKFIQNIPKDKDFKIEFSIWNSNIDFAMRELKISNFELPYKLSENEKNILNEKDVINITKYLEEIYDKSNIQFVVLIYIIEKLNNKYNSIGIFNDIINNCLGTIKDALTILMPLYLFDIS